MEKLEIKYERALDLAKNNDPSSNDKFKTLWNGKIRKANSKINHFVYLFIPFYQFFRFGQGYAESRADFTNTQ